MEKVLPVIRAEMSKLKVAAAADRVYKDECVYSFDSPFSDGGLYVNLRTLQGIGERYLDLDRRKSGSNLYLHQKWNQILKEEKPTDGEKDAPTKLAIGVEGGFMSESKYDIVKEHQLIVFVNDQIEKILLPNQEIPEFVSAVVESVIKHEGMKKNLQLSSWEADTDRKVSKYANDLLQLNPSGMKIPQDPKEWKDEETGATENLWLNLSTGYIGGGRKNWDGSGGSGSALRYYEETGKKYPLAVKLGTITPHGAEVYSYAPDENDLVIDPKLAEHLSFWGIDIMKLEKTDKTMGEMEVALNMTYDWSRILEGHEELEKLHGPGLVGLQNVGSSCYMNSLIQTLAVIPEIQERYLHTHDRIVETAPNDPTQDLPVQFNKVLEALMSDRYIPPTPAEEEGDSKMSVSLTEEDGISESQLEKYVIAPRMFKHLVGKGHVEFSSGRQQDVSEYFLYLLEQLAQSERINLTRYSIGMEGEAVRYTPSIFDFYTEQRFQCEETNQVRYMKKGDQTLLNILDLRVPLEAATSIPISETEKNEPESKKARTGNEGKNDEDQFIPFETCLQTFFSPDTVEMMNPVLGRKTLFTKTTKFQTFPRYLMVKIARYYAGADWIQRKISARIDVPEVLDLSGFKGVGPQSDEVLIPDENAEDRNSSTTAAPAEVDENILAQLVSMGFTENACRKAALATGGKDAEAAMNWVFAHMDDPNFNDPPEPVAATKSATPSVDTDAVMMLSSMGYNENQATAALLANGNNIERAADWLFSHTEDLDIAVAQALADAASGENKSSGSSNGDCADGVGRYTLMAVISHIGKSTDHGHYVCHIKKKDKWVLFNDEKVGGVPKAPFGYGFMYLYRRDDAPGTFALP